MDADISYKTNYEICLICVKKVTRNEDLLLQKIQLNSEALNDKLF